jgi:adenine C2-methylase RlmN of 23S rRNA A2503 and tRNA A37
MGLTQTHIKKLLETVFISIHATLIFEYPYAFFRFLNLLKERNVPATIRQSFGVDIDAACGQLYANYERSIRKSKPQTPPT